MDLDKRSKIFTLTGVSYNTVTHVEAQKLAGIKKNNVKIKKRGMQKISTAIDSRKEPAQYTTKFVSISTTNPAGSVWNINTSL